MGDQGVGKSTIKDQYIVLKSRPLPQNLTQAGTKSKPITTESQKFKLQLWDVNADFEKIILLDVNVFTGIHGIVLIFDVTNVHSLNYIRRIYPKLSSVLNNKNIPIILVGNKTDLRNEFETAAMHLSYEKGLYMANELSNTGLVFLRIPYFETSIEDPESYKVIFHFITTKLLGMFS
jgi:GTPase SAR1 family protein